MFRYPDVTRILSDLQWAVVGGVATRLYMPERATLDLDIAVLATDTVTVRSRLKNSGYAYVGEMSIGGSSWTSPDGVSVDVVELDAPWTVEALAEARTNPDGQGYPTIPLHYLVLMKVQAGRLQDLADVSRMLGQASVPELGRVRDTFRRFAPEDLEDLESLIALGRLEMG